MRVQRVRRARVSSEREAVMKSVQSSQSDTVNAVAEELTGASVGPITADWRFSAEMEVEEEVGSII